MFILRADMKANNYEVTEAGETITFRGIVQRSLSQAFFLVFCTAISMATLALVLGIQFQDLGTSVMASYCFGLYLTLCAKLTVCLNNMWPQNFPLLESQIGI